MDAAAHVAALRHEGDAFIVAAERAPAVPVPTCPGWDMPTLLRHVGGVHRWCGEIVRTGRQVRRREMPVPEDDAGFEALVAWYREGLEGLCATLAETPPEAEAWSFSSVGNHTAGWWQRRMVGETAVHRWDAQHAGGPGVTEPLAPDTAVEGIAEYLGDFLPRALESVGVQLRGTLHLHATDDVEGGEWLVDFDTSPVAVDSGHAKADTAIRGPASDLLLWLWNRLAAGGAHLEVFGSPDPVTAWPRLTL